MDWGPIAAAAIPAIVGAVGSAMQNRASREQGQSDREQLHEWSLEEEKRRMAFEALKLAYSQGSGGGGKRKLDYQLEALQSALAGSQGSSQLVQNADNNATLAVQRAYGMGVGGR